MTTTGCKAIGCGYGTTHACTMRGMSMTESTTKEDCYLRPAHTVTTFKSPPAMGCKSGGTWVRPFGDLPNNLDGFYDCARMCKGKGYKYFGLECPRATVHCQCANSLIGSTTVSVSQCSIKRGSAQWQARRRARTHCQGPFKAGQYNMGSHGVGSVYYTSPAPPTATPTAMPTSRPTSYPSHSPTAKPTLVPTSKPTGNPTKVPTEWVARRRIALVPAPAATRRRRHVVVESNANNDNVKMLDV